ncbi:MAG TPA: 3',5'-cyclic-nucleotide phosphodiesterase [Candidatus Binatia bacterium]|jgi:3',5'-cyclic-nucleotide phosphodiesterase
MQFRVLGCSGGEIPGQHLSSYLINETLLIDAGSTTAVLSLRAQRKIENVLITHAHLDHVMSLATMADNLFGIDNTTIHVWGLPDVVAGLHASFFNDTLWPDFTRITADSQSNPILTFHQLTKEKPTAVGEFSVTAVRVSHAVASTAFFIEDRKGALLHVGDTGPTEKVWTVARKKKNLRAVVLETSFPNRLQETADLSQHLTPQTLAHEAAKLGHPSVPIFVTHLKPQYRDEIVAELRKLKGFRLRILRQGDSVRL